MLEQIRLTWLYGYCVSSTAPGRQGLEAQRLAQVVCDILAVLVLRLQLAEDGICVGHLSLKACKALSANCQAMTAENNGAPQRASVCARVSWRSES